MSSEDESSWRLLFNIALSHGDALHSGQLSWDGWMIFLSSAKLIGTATGVFPVLLEQLWQRQGLSQGAIQERDTHGGDTAISSSFFLDNTSLDASNAVATRSVEFVEFGGFVDMMKVLCMRIYQTYQFATVRERQGEHTDAVLVALRRSAEDRVLLTEAVRFAASRYLRPFIAKSTIHATSQVSVRGARNQWALHVNRLVTHVVGALAQGTLVPLYRTYADAAAGRLTEEGYKAFLRDYLPSLNTIEETCALAIFAHGGFPDVRPLLETASLLSATTSKPSPLLSGLTLGLTDFIDALLMLAVVVSADEERHPKLRPITAKVWTFFERYICNGENGGGTSMCVDPYVSGRYAAMPPGLVCLFPTVAPLLPCPTLLVEVCNATCTADCGDESVARVPAPATSATHSHQRSPASPPGEAKTPFLTEVSALEVADPQLAAAETDVAVAAASPFFASQWSLLERNAAVPLFGEGGAATSFQVTVGGTVVRATPTTCPDIWQVGLDALSLGSVRLARCAVEAAPLPDSEITAASAAAADADAKGEDGGQYAIDGVKLIFTPIRSFPVELVAPESKANGMQAEDCQGPSADGDAAGSVITWGCKDVVLTDTPVTQIVASPLVQQLHRILLSDGHEAPDAANASSSVDVNVDGGTAAAATPDPLTASSLQKATFSLSTLCRLCRQLQWGSPSSSNPAADLDARCSQALTRCRLYHRTLHSSGTPNNEEARSPSSVSAQKMSLLEVLVCLALLLLREPSGGLCDLPDVPRRLELALHSAATPADPAANLVTTDANTHILPHNKLRDEPFKLALERKEAQSKASRERRATLVKALQRHHKLQLSSPVTLPPLPESRPNAMQLVSQYGNVDSAADFQRVMQESAETVKAYFIEKELAIPEWQGNC